MPPRLHLLAVPHTVTRADFSHCAFTGKVLRFGPMMRAQGYEVLHYGTDQAESGATEDVVVMTVEEQEALLGHQHHSDPTAFVGKDANVSSPLYRQWNLSTRDALKERVAPGDVVCLPFGKAHEAAVSGLPIFDESDRSAAAWLVETGIGYQDTFAPYRIYESEAWRHVAAGNPRRGQMGSDWEWVIPNYFDVREWPIGAGQGDERGPYLLYFGRIIDTKGLLMVTEIARHRPDLRVILCGQGDAGYYLAQSPNLEYRPPVTGTERARLLGGALAVLMPTRYVEPFGGVTVEAHLCGTPVLASSFGCFTETIAHGRDGFRCRTLGDYLAAIEIVERWSAGEGEGGLLETRRAIRAAAIDRYSLEAVGPLYTEAFETIRLLGDRGILSRSSFLGSITKAIEPGPSPARLAADNPEAAWKMAQAWERNWWTSHPHLWDGEREKQETYAKLLEIPHLPDAGGRADGLLFDRRDQRVLDVGCGPFSLLLRTKLAGGTAVDPLDFGPDLEAAYHRAGLQRIIAPAERIQVRPGDFEEAWCYNCLQHVLDPRVALETLAAAAPVVRLFEWLDMPPTDGHPHMLTEALFAEAFPEARWRRVKWEIGVLETPALHGKYLAAVLRRDA